MTGTSGVLVVFVIVSPPKTSSSKVDENRGLHSPSDAPNASDAPQPLDAFEHLDASDALAEPHEPSSELASAESKPATAARPYIHAVGTAAFGALPENSQHQAELFATRLRKRAKHFRKMMARRNITCFRLYERDVPEIPLVVDRYENYLHLSEFERPHDRDVAQHAAWLDLMAETAGKALDVPKNHVYLKRRSRQRGNTQHEKVSQTDQGISVQEGGLTFLVNLADYIDTRAAEGQSTLSG